MTKAARALRVAAAVLAWAVLAVFLFVASALAHLGSPMGRRVTGQLVTAAVESQIPGRMTIGEVTQVGAGGTLRARDVSFETAGGQRVVWGDEVRADLDVTAALSGKVRLTQLDVTGGGVRVRAPKKGRISIERAFAAAGGPPGPPKDAADIDLRSQFEGLSLAIDVADGPSLRFRGLDGFMRVTRAPSGWMRVRLDRVGGTWVKPGPMKGNVAVRSLSGLIAAGAERIVDMRLVLVLGGDPLEGRLEYFVEPKPRVKLRVEGRGPKAVLTSLGLKGLGSFIEPLEVERGDVRSSPSKER